MQLSSGVQLIKAIEHFFHVGFFIVLYKVVITLKSVD